MSSEIFENREDDLKTILTGLNRKAEQISKTKGGNGMNDNGGFFPPISNVIVSFD